MKGKRKEAEALLRKAAKFSGVTLPDKVFLTDEDKPMKTDSLVDNDTKIKPNQGDDDDSGAPKEEEKVELKTDEDNNVKVGKESDGQDMKVEFVPSPKQQKKSLTGLMSKLQAATDTSTETDKEPKEVARYKILDLFKSRKLLIYSIAMWFIW